MLKRVQQQWTTNFSTKSRARGGGRVERKMWGIKLKWGRLKESESQTPYWEKKRPECQNPEGGFRPWGASAVSVRAWTQRANLSLPPPLSKAHPILGSSERIWKGIGSVFLSPHRRNNARATVWTWKCFIWEQPCVSHRLDVILSEKAGETLFSITFKSVHFSESL